MTNPSLLSVAEYANELEHGFIEQRAVAIALKYAVIDGSQNRWVIDQMLRLISGSAYKTIVKIYETENGPGSWDTGTQPNKALHANY